jgi:hypothetical protein
MIDYTSPTPPPRDIAIRIARVAGPVIVAAVGVFMVAWTWFKWPDPIVDFGRELYVPWKLSEGQVLYRDIAYFNGPFSPYFNSIVFRVLGVSLQSLVIANLVILSLIVVMIWRLWSLIADSLAATVACVLFLTLFGFIQLGGIANYNFVTPYSHELTHGIALSLAGILCVAALVHSPHSLGRVWIAVGGLVLGLVFLTKAEVFVAAAGAMLTGIVLGLRAGGASLRSAGRALGQFAVSAALPPLLAAVVLSSAMPPLEALRGTLGSWVYLFDPQVVGMKFYKRILGTDDLGNNIHSMMEGLMWWAALFGGVAAIALAIRAPVLRRAWMWLVYLLLTGLGMWLIGHYVDARWDHAFRGLTVVMLATTIGTFFRARSSVGIVRVMVCLFSLLLLGKMVLNVMLVHYGFALAMPATMATSALLICWWPDFLDRRGGSGMLLRAAALSATGFTIFTYLHVYQLLASDKQVTVGTGRDAFLADVRMRSVEGETFEFDHRGRAVNLALSALGRLPRDATLACIPEGTMLNYLSRRTNPTPYINLMPPEVLMFDQERILRAFQQNPPDYILLVLGSDPATFGFKSFASDYGKLIYDWIAQNYRQVETPVEPAYPLRLMERKR